MLQINEVKIDNYVTNSKGDIFQISTGAFCLYHQNKEWDVLSIELTEEWLLIFGFEVDDDLGDQIYYQIPNQKNGYGICFDLDDIAFYKFYGNGGENVHTLIHDEEHLQYVHQLQNLYYALTQTELTLKDEK